jgi:acyl-CoA thioesterase
VPGLWTDLLACLQLRVKDGAQFEGDSQRLNYHRVFGGQLLGQFIRTASASAVTSHTIWFHRSFRTDRRLLLRQHSPVLAHGRCFPAR